MMSYDRVCDWIIMFLSVPQGITFEEFRSFFQFLNNLEDFAIAMQMYNFASRSIGQGFTVISVVLRLEKWTQEILCVGMEFLTYYSTG